VLRHVTYVAAADTARRLIEGVAVPYNEAAEIGWARYQFERGSLTPARGRTPFLLGHDPNRPVGVLEALEDGPDGARARFRVDKTADGDTALEQAKSGSRGGLSIGFELERWAELEDGLVSVEAARLYEVSLVSVPAFESATVERVAAQHTETPDPDPEADPEADPDAAEDPADPDPEADPDAAAELEADPEEEEEIMPELETVSVPAPPAEHPPVIRAAKRETAPPATAGEMVSYLIRAQHGDTRARRYLEAALTESISTDVSGLLPKTYERTVIGEKTAPRPLYDLFRSKPLPGVGLQVDKPVWTTPPVGAWAATVDADATSTKVAIGTQSATVLRWDWAGAIPWVVVQRSDPSVIDEIYAAAVENFHAAVEAKIGGEVLAAPPATATTLGAAVGEFFIACGKTPDAIVAAPDVWGELADAGELSVPVAAGDPSAGGTALTSTFAGIPVSVSGTLAAGNAVLATRRAVDARTTEPVRLTANAIGALNVELAVVGEGLFDTDYPTELLLIAAVTPPARSSSAPSSKK